MKQIKTSLRIWIAVSSVVGFFGGWVLLAHAPKPAQASQVVPSSQAELTPLPTLAPLPALGSQDSSLQQMPSFSLPLLNSPRMRTGGS